MEGGWGATAPPPIQQDSEILRRSRKFRRWDGNCNEETSSRTLFTSGLPAKYVKQKHFSRLGKFGPLPLHSKRRISATGRTRPVGAFFRLEGHQFAVKAGSSWGSGGGAPGQNFRAMASFLLATSLCA